MEYLLFEGVTEGDYEVVADGYGLAIFEQGVHVPGIHTVAGEELARYEINLKDKNGSAAVVDQLILSKGKNEFADLDYWSG